MPGGSKELPGVFWLHKRHPTVKPEGKNLFHRAAKTNVAIENTALKTHILRDIINLYK